MTMDSEKHNSMGSSSTEGIRPESSHTESHPHQEHKPPNDVENGLQQPDSDTSGPVLKRKKHMPGWRLSIIFACIGLGLFLSLLDATVVATMLVDISTEFQDFKTASWVVLAYTLTEVGFAVAMARLSDCLGRKPVIVASFIIFLAASMGCGASKTLDQLIGFRAAQGVGGAGLYSMALISYPELSPPSKIVIVSGAMGFVVALAGVCGPVVGGLLTSYVGWRYVFWINGPCAFVPAVILFFLWPIDYQLTVPVSFRCLDYFGAILVLAGTVLPVFIINQAAIKDYAWNSGTTISVLIISGLCWIILLLWQRQLERVPKYRHIHPQLPWRLLTNRVMLAAILDTLLSGFVLLLTIINIPLRAQIVNLYGPVKAGVLLLPMMAGGATGCALGGGLSMRRNNTFPVLVAASVIILISSGLLINLPDTVDPPTKQWGIEVLLGVGLGLKISSTTFIAVLEAEFEDYAIAQGIIAQMRVFGGSIGVAVSIIVLIAKIQSSLQDSLTNEELQNFYRSPLILFTFTPEQQEKARMSFIDTFNIDMYICIGVSALSLFVALFTFQRHPPSVKSKLADLEAELRRAEGDTAS